ncbi:Wzz/FepE/Etk N-terminal domain-containing protein [Streptomonospora alba]|uniref:Wzz/FepE/Etk N-terminal domain-containing protein n=1 Tax=Streptomonospora alba TaxID=183763 RepID=UPI00069BE305|nr:Wzz/FepE/Etk N-terminal domain-containing protein [Streptomonospora alba]
MDTSAGGDLTDVAATVRRRWRVVAACAAAGLVLAALALLVVPPTYTSTTAVHVRPTGVPEITGEQSGRTVGDVNLDTEAQIVRSAEVSAAAAERLGSGADPAELRRRVEVTVPPNSSVLQISYPGSDRRSARRASAAFADAYLEYREDQIDRQVGDILSSLRDEVDARYTELDRIPDEDGDGALRQGRIAAVQDEIAELNKEIHPLTALRSSVVPARIITPATTPEEATSPVPVLWLAAGGVLGLAAGLTAAFGADRRDRRLHTVRDAERAAGVPVLLRTQRSESADGAEPAREAQQANRAALSLVSGIGDLGAQRRSGAVVLVPGVSRGGASATAATVLAAALARVGADVLLVRADPASAGAADGAGLADALLGGADPAELERRTASAPGLRILDYGGADAADMLQRPAMSGLLDRLRTQADYVVVATAPTGERADACALARGADAVVPVIELGATRIEDLASALAAFAAVDATVPGTVAAPAGVRKRLLLRGRSERAERAASRHREEAAEPDSIASAEPEAAEEEAAAQSPQEQTGVGGADAHDGTDLALKR